MSSASIELPWGAQVENSSQHPRLHHRLTLLRAEYGPLVPLRTYRRDPLVVVGREVVAHLAHSPEANEKLRHEVTTRRWAERVGVGVPACGLVQSCDTDEYSMISTRVPAFHQNSPEYAYAAINAARAVQCSRVEPPPTEAHSRNRRPVRARRAVRAIFSPLSIQEIFSVREAVAALPTNGWAHGNFRPSNVLYDRASRHVHVVGWGHIGRAWTGSDLLYLWAHLDDPQVADILLEAVLSDRSADTAPEVGLVLLWSSLRVLMEQATGGPIRERNSEHLAKANARVARARRLARALGTSLPWPGTPNY